jgi:hypothetical protein
MQDFISQYLDYVGTTECPTTYQRWCCISLIGAYLGRQYSFKFGHFNIHPNKYIMLIGTPGARKSTAIKIAKNIITQAGYDKISADKSSKEKFILDLAGDDSNDSNDILESNLWGAQSSGPAEVYIACDEFNDFIGNGNFEFISLLGSFWDWNGAPFKNRIKNGTSVTVTDPTVSILGGNTPVNFARAFPPEILGQGFFSRLLLIHGEPTGRRITFPIPPCMAATAHIVAELQRVKRAAVGVAELSSSAYKLLDKIYQTEKPLDDIRFEHYSTRRFQHLLKLCLILSASSFSARIEEAQVVQANTILTHAEHLMPKALGEFGKSRNSDITHKIMGLLNTTIKPMPLKELWEYLHKDMEKVGDLAELLRNLATAEKVQMTGTGFLARKKVIEEVRNDILDYSYLTEEERNMST